MQIKTHIIAIFFVFTYRVGCVLAYYTNDEVTKHISDVNDLIHDNLDDMSTFLSNTVDVSIVECLIALVYDLKTL